MMSEATPLHLGARQEAMQILDWVESRENCILRVALRIGVVALITFFVPIIEEYIFRELNWISAVSGEGIARTAGRIGGNGLFFGAVHLSPFQQGSNISIFLATAVLGVFYALMREISGGRLVSTVAHMAHNSVVTLGYYKLID